MHFKKLIGFPINRGLNHHIFQSKTASRATELQNIQARGTTDPGYWVHNSNHHPWQNECKFQFSDFYILLHSRLGGQNLSHVLCHLPVILLFHSFNDHLYPPQYPVSVVIQHNVHHHLPMVPIFSSNIPCNSSPPCRPPWWPPSPHWALTIQLPLHTMTLMTTINPNCPIGIIS